MTRRLHLQRGLSLVEILVSLVIGLVVVGAVLVSYLGTGTSGQQQSAYSQMTEDAQLTFTIINRDLLNAGYGTPAGWAGGTSTFSRAYVSGTPNFAVFGCDSGFADPGATSLACTSTLSASLSVAYEADAVTTVPTSGGTPTDCLGGQLPQTSVVVGTATITYYLARNRYHVATNATTTIPELYCTTPNTARQPVAENVESMKIWYGVEGGTAKQVGAYVNAAGVTDWNRVISVRVCLLMRSRDEIFTAEDLAIRNTYLNCDGASTALPDRRARRAFFSTTTLRNRQSF